MQTIASSNIAEKKNGFIQFPALQETQHTTPIQIHIYRDMTVGSLNVPKNALIETRTAIQFYTK